MLAILMKPTAIRLFSFIACAYHAGCALALLVFFMERL